MDKRFGAIVLSVIAVIFGIFYFTKDNTDKSSTGNNSNAVVSNHTKGTGTIQLVEYGDFECSACGQYGRKPESLNIVPKYRFEEVFAMMQ